MVNKKEGGVAGVLGEQDPDASASADEERPTYATEIEKFFAMVTQMVVLSQ